MPNQSLNGLRVRNQPAARAVELPDRAVLIRRFLDGLSGTGVFVDAHEVARRPGQPTDPQIWTDAIFRDPPTWVRGAMAAREVVVGLVGIERTTPDTFAALDHTDSEVLLGEDAGHLRFRASVVVGADTVTVCTVASTVNLRGRLYFAPVRRVHPYIVRAMLRRAARRLPAVGD